jgi:hypothetical protein
MLLGVDLLMRLSRTLYVQPPLCTPRDRGRARVPLGDQVLRGVPVPLQGEGRLRHHRRNGLLRAGPDAHSAGNCMRSGAIASCCQPSVLPLPLSFFNSKKIVCPQVVRDAFVRE